MNMNGREGDEDRNIRTTASKVFHVCIPVWVAHITILKLSTTVP
jgi:hypothetical protein